MFRNRFQKKKNLFFYELTDFRVIKINKISTDLTYGLKRLKEHHRAMSARR